MKIAYKEHMEGGNLPHEVEGATWPCHMANEEAPTWRGHIKEAPIQS